MKGCLTHIVDHVDGALPLVQQIVCGLQESSRSRIVEWGVSEGVTALDRADLGGQHPPDDFKLVLPAGNVKCGLSELVEEEEI